MSEGDRPRLCLLPGLDGTGRLYARFASQWDSRGPVGTLDYDSRRFDSYEALTDELRPRLPTEPFVLVAESFAGPLAIQLAASQPEGLRGLVLAATFAHAPLPLSRFLAAILVRMPAVLPPGLLLEQLLAGGYGDPLLRAELDAVLAQIPVPVLHRRALAALGCDVRSTLASLGVPVLCLVPTRDRLIRRSASDEMVVLARHARSVRIDAPHFVFQTAAAACAEAIGDFIASSVVRR